MGEMQKNVDSCPALIFLCFSRDVLKLDAHELLQSAPRAKTDQKCLNSERGTFKIQ